jgi:hypothetical protein
MDPQLKEHITAKDTWIRGLFILLFAILLGVAKIVTWAVVVVQFLFTVFQGETNGNLKQFGAGLSRFVYQTMLYLTYNSDDKPFPFQPWPGDVDTKPATPLEPEDTPGV